MAVSTRIIRRRIKTVANTKKITKAMELVSAAKMRRAVASMTAGRPYAKAAVSALSQLSTLVDAASHPLLRGNNAKKSLVILVTSDRSLCGGFNSKLFATVTAHMRDRDAAGVDFAVLGTKGQDFLRKRGYSIVAAWNAPSKSPTFAEVKPVADIAIREFMAGKYSAVTLITTDYKSALVQMVRTVNLLPLTAFVGDPVSQDDVEESREAMREAAQSGSHDMFEPNAQSVLSAILPRLVESQVYHGLLESLASEHSARMLAMRSATDSASDMIDSLTLTFNQARQAGITREIAEISAGAAAIA